ncbi:MAG: hypothetical protein AAF993_13705 [Pseudomonadota bacterium]
MQYFKSIRRFCAQFALLFSVLFIGQGAWAEGTDSGTVVTNSVTMSFTVNSVAQTATTNVDFTVDRKLRLDVTTPQTEWVTAVPGQLATTGSAIQFVVTNNSNSSTDVVVAVLDQLLQQVDGFSAVGSTAITPTVLNIWEDTNGDGVFDGGENSLGNTPGSYALTGTLAEDEQRTISISMEVPGAAGADQYQAYTLVAAVANAGVALGNDDSGNVSPGGTAANNPNLKDSVEIVFADQFTGSLLGDDEGYNFITDAVTNADDADFDGQAVNASGFRTRIALGIAKHVEVIWDPISGNRYDAAGAPTAVNPKAIPGALLLYIIGVNANSGLNATAVTIDDDIPETLVDPGNTTAQAPAAVNMPATVGIDINGATVNFALAGGVTANTEYHVQNCAGGAIVSTAFAASPEVDDANLGPCNDGDTGYVAYVVTVDDSP